MVTGIRDEYREMCRQTGMSYHDVRKAAVADGSTCPTPPAAIMDSVSLVLMLPVSLV